MQGRHRIVLWFVVMMIGAAALALTGCGSSAVDGASAPQTVTVVESQDEAEKAEAEAEAVAPEEKAASDETVSQENARGSAESYLDTSAFSRKGLINQLSSEYGAGFSKADAIYAVNHIDVDWNEQAARSAKSYLDTSTFSRQGLIEQLESEYGAGFTHAQAVYGVNQTGL